MSTFNAHRLRPYRPADLPAILASIGDWNARTAGCGYLHPGDICHYMSNGLRGRDLDKSFYRYEEDERVLALVVLYSASDAGYDALVHPDHRGGDLEQGLVAWCERALWDRPRVAAWAPVDAPTAIGAEIMNEVMDCDAVRRDLLLQRGYVPAGAPAGLYTTRSLADPIPASALPEGFTIRSASGEHEAAMLSAVHNGAFTPKWGPDDYLSVMRTPGYDAERELVVVAPGGRFAAFLVYWLDPVSRAGLFEPVGCHREFQRRGLTKALMYEGMRRMVASGMTTAIVKYNADNIAGAALYGSAGFQTLYTITAFRKRMA
jgi:ribosomal protein S18 acetylase RimI-like enzyme